MWSLKARKAGRQAVPGLGANVLLIGGMLLGGAGPGLGQVTGRVDSLLLTLAAQPPDSVRYETLYALATVYRGSDIPKARAYATQALGLAARRREEAGQARCHALLGWVFRQEGNPLKARLHSRAALALWARLETPEGRYQYYSSQGNLLLDEETNSPRALAYLEKARLAALSAGLAGHLPETDNQIGLLYKQQGQLRLARTYFLKAVREAPQLPGDRRGLVGAFYNNLSALALSEGKTDEARRWARQALALNRRYGNLLSQTHSLEALGRLYTAQRKPRQAAQAFAEALALARQVRSVSRQHRLYQLLSESYERSREPQRALTYFKRYNRLSDSLLVVRKEQQLMEFRHQARVKEERIRRLSLETDSFRRRLAYLGGGATLLLLLLGAVGYQYWQLRRRNLGLQGQLVQLKLRMKELHHRVKNNLAIVSGLLNLQSYQLRDEAAIGVIRRGQERVEAMSLIHQQLYQADSQTQVNVQEYLLNLTENLLRAHGYGPDYFDLRFDITVEWLDVNLAIPIGLIANELITNALKYAYQHTEQPVLRVSLRTEPALVLEVADNGPGFDLSSWQSTSGSFGKQLVKALGRQLGGHLKICFDNGTCVQLCVPAVAR